MKKKITHFLGALLCVTLSLSSSSQTTENFDSRSGYTLDEIQQLLESSCWTFTDFSINNKNWKPNIGGDGAMVSEPHSNPHVNMGIYTPVLDIPGQVTVSFRYKFKNGNGNGNRRYLRIYITDAYNKILKRVDSVELNNINGSTVYSYSKTFKNLGSGSYKVFINYQGTGLATVIAIDEINISANKVYSMGCNVAPYAVDDVIEGKVDRTASGFICTNDSDPDGEIFWPYIVTNSNDGNVEIADDGSFIFTPKPGFSGNNTTFKYRICDEGSTPLCSNDATVTINFPTAATLPVSLIDFSGMYQGQGSVKLSWTTTFETNSDRFDIERSFDGNKWEKVGTQQAKGTSTINVQYAFIDDAGKNTVNRKDLYYRLKQIDLDGKVSVGRILIVRVYNTRSVKAVSVTPNPAKNDITVNFELEEQSVVTLKIINSGGAEVQRKSLKSGKGIHSVLMEGSSRLKPGLYILEVIINSKERMIVKLIKE